MQQIEINPQRVYIRDLRDSEQIAMPLLISKKQLRDRRDGVAKYLALILADRTGRIEGRVWDNALHWNEAFSEGDVVLVKGQVKTFEGKFQLMINAMRACKAGEFEPSDFLPTVEADRAALLDYLLKTVGKMESEPIRRLMLSFFEDEAFLKAFSNAPGAVSVHHNYLGGLLEHTHAVMTFCEAAYLLYPNLDLDLLLAGAILHDIGKIDKYRYDTLIDMSDKGQFLGHIAIGSMMVSERISRLDIEFPEELKMKLLHLILSHHGTLEWGSPVEPKTLEALILHFADNMDAKVNQFSQVLKSHTDPGKRWTNYDPKLGRCLFVGETVQMPAQDE